MRRPAVGLLACHGPCPEGRSSSTPSIADLGDHSVRPLSSVAVLDLPTRPGSQDHHRAKGSQTVLMIRKLDEQFRHQEATTPCQSPTVRPSAPCERCARIGSTLPSPSVQEDLQELLEVGPLTRQLPEHPAVAFRRCHRQGRPAHHRRPAPRTSAGSAMRRSPSPSC